MKKDFFHVRAPKMTVAWGTMVEPEVLSHGNFMAAEDKGQA